MRTVMASNDLHFSVKRSFQPNRWRYCDILADVSEIKTRRLNLLKVYFRHEKIYMLTPF